MKFFKDGASDFPNLKIGVPRHVLRLALFFLIGFVWVPEVGATNYYISTSGSDANSGLSGFPKATLQDIINDYDLSAGDIIYVEAGTYTEKGIIVGGVAGGINDGGFTIQGDGTLTTIFDSDQTEYWLEIQNGTDNTGITISDITIKDYRPSGSNLGGAGIYVAGQSRTYLTLSDVVFDNCDANGLGSGGAIYSGIPTNISSCVFKNCSTTGFGGAVSFGTYQTAMLTIEKTKFYSCSAAYGAALHVEHQANSITLTANLTNCLFYENNSTTTGTVYFSSIYGAALTNSIIINCTLADNTSTGTGGVFNDFSGASINIDNTLGYNNSNYDFRSTAGTMTFDYSLSTAAGTKSGTTSNTNLKTGNPSFISSANDNYTLMKSSNCYQAGTATGAPADDLRGTARLSPPSIGCYEYAAIYYVNDAVMDGDEIWCTGTGSDATTDGSDPATPYLTLNAAVAVAVNGDVIRVDVGTYTDYEVNFNEVTSGGQTLTVVGAGAEKTIFDGGGTNKPFQTTAGSPSGYKYTLNLSDVKIYDYYNDGTAHAALTLISGCAVTLTDVIITNSRNGPAVYIGDGTGGASFVMTGGGIFCSAAGGINYAGNFAGNGSLELTNVAFIENSGFSNGYGSAIRVGDGFGFASDPSTDYEANASKIKITGCTFENNTATNTSTVYIHNNNTSGTVANYEIKNCVFKNNTVSTGGGSYGGCVSIKKYGTITTLDHCLFENNTNAASLGTLALHADDYSVTQCKFTGNTTTSSEGKDLYCRAPSASQKASYAMLATSVSVNNCFFLSADDKISRNTSTDCSISLVESGTPTNVSDYSGDSQSQTYTWVDVTVPIWAGDCTAGYSESSCIPPSNAATGIGSSSVTSTTATISWTKGPDADGTLIVVKSGSAPNNPTSGVSYTANTAFGSGTDVGSSSYVVYKSSGNSVAMTGLSPNTTYYVEAWSYLNTDNCFISTNVNTSFTTDFAYLYVDDNTLTGNEWVTAYDGDGANDEAGCGDINNPCASVQYVMSNNTLTSAHIIRVDKGTYEHHDINADDTDDNFTVQGAGIDITIFDFDEGSDFPSGDNQAFIFINNGSVTIKDLTIKQYLHTPNGGGIEFSETSAATFTAQRVKFDELQSNSNHAGALYLTTSGGTSSLLLDSCIFIDNDAAINGGAVYLNGGASATYTMTKCIFQGNTGAEGGAIFLNNGALNMTNCLLVNNNIFGASSDGTINLNGTANHSFNHITLVDNNNGSGDDPGITQNGSGTVSIKNSIIWDSNESTGKDLDQDAGTFNVDESCYGPNAASYITEGTVNYTNSITSNSVTYPMFVSPGSPNWNYHLKTGSPAIDNADATGSPDDDLDGVTRSDPDMGCFEGDGCSVLTASMTAASAVTFSNVSETQMTVGWTRGNQAGVYVVVRQDNNSVGDISAYTTYTVATQNWSSRASNTSTDGGNSYVMYKGTGTSVTITNLTALATYYVEVWEYVADPGCVQPTPTAGNQEAGCNLVWDAATTTDWGTATNWTPNQLPTSACNVTITNIATLPTIDNTENATCKALTIDNGATLTVDITSGSFQISGNLLINGTIASGASLSKEIELLGTSNTIGGTGDFIDGNPPLTFNVKSGASYTQSSNIDIETLKLEGTFSQSTYTLKLSGNFIRETSGSFNCNTGTIEFNGVGTQHVNITSDLSTAPASEITFYNLTASGSDVRLYYDVSDYKVNVTNQLSISGTLKNMEK